MEKSNVTTLPNAKVKKEKSRGDIWQFYGKSFVEDQLACESSFAAMVVRLDDNKK